MYFSVHSFAAAAAAAVMMKLFSVRLEREIVKNVCLIYNLNHDQYIYAIGHFVRSQIFDVAIWLLLSYEIILGRLLRRNASTL